MNVLRPNELWMGVRQSLVGHASAVARLYDKWSAGMSVSAWYRDDRILAHLDTISSYRPKEVLEIGFGDGRVVQHLAKRMPDCQFFGVDLSETMLAAGERRCVGLRNVKLYLGDWIEPVQGRIYNVILIKNALHLIPNLKQRLLELNKVSDTRTKLVIVETVSPSVMCREFVRSLFHIIDRKGVKVNYFTQPGLLRVLRGAGWKREYSYVVNQTMSVDDWLKFKVDTELERSAVKHEISNAPDEIIRQMNVIQDGSHISMLRRQFIVFLGRNESVVGKNVVNISFGNVR